MTHTGSLEDFQLDLSPATQSMIAVTMILMIYAVALGIKPAHFRFFKDNPKIYLGGIIAQILGLPLLTLSLCFLLNPSAGVALGLLLAACVPGGNISNILTLFARGNTALSVSLTATSSLLGAFLTPVALLFWTSLYPPTHDLLQSFKIDSLRFVFQTLLLLGLPLVAGMTTAALAPQFAQRIQMPLAFIGGLGTLGVIVFTFTQFFPAFRSFVYPVFGYVVLHNALAFCLGYVTGRIIGADKPTRRSLTFEVGIQNAGIGIVILLTQLGGLGSTAAIIGLWGAWHAVSGLILVTLFRLSDRQSRLHPGSEPS